MAVILVLLDGAGVLGGLLCALFAWPHAPASSAMAVEVLAMRVSAPVLCCLAAFYYADLYDLRAMPSFSRFARRLPWSMLGAAALLAGLYAWSPEFRLPWRPLGQSLVGGAVLVLLLRAGSYALARVHPQRVLFVGASPLACQLAEEIAAQPNLGWIVLGMADDEAFDGASLGVSRLGSLADLEEILSRERPDRIIVTLAARRGRLPVRTLLRSRMAGVAIEDGVEVYERLTGKLAIEGLAPSALIFSKDFGTSQVQLALNRGLSLMVAGLSLLVLAPILLLTAVIVVLDSPGPVFFVQERVGALGRRFKLIKFRTMRPARERTSEWARDNGHRVTRVGKWLRRFHVDELPQFLNVLRGDMNLVGPRPHPVSNRELFAHEIPYYALRAAVRPGITGWAQVRYGYANGLEEETEKMRYDLYYIKHMSAWLDLRILVDTVKNILLGGGRPPTSARPMAVPIAGVRRTRWTNATAGTDAPQQTAV